MSSLDIRSSPGSHRPSTSTSSPLSVAWTQPPGRVGGHRPFPFLAHDGIAQRRGDPEGNPLGGPVRLRRALGIDPHRLVLADRLETDDPARDPPEVCVGEYLLRSSRTDGCIFHWGNQRPSISPIGGVCSLPAASTRRPSGPTTAVNLRSSWPVFVRGFKKLNADPRGLLRSSATHVEDHGEDLSLLVTKDAPGALMPPRAVVHGHPETEVADGRLPRGDPASGSPPGAGQEAPGGRVPGP